jgi:hypothetical protein
MTERIVSPEIVRRVRLRDGICLAGLVMKDGCSWGVDVHHISSRGSGGDDTLENLICLCRRHHNKAHAGELSRGRLRAILHLYWSYIYTDEELAED